MRARTTPQRRSATERFYDDATPEWVSCGDLARLLGCSRVHAWRTMQTLRRSLGQAVVQKDPEGHWRARTHAVARWIANRQRTPAERMAALENRVAELEDHARERDARVDRLAAELQAVRDMARMANAATRRY